MRVEVNKLNKKFNNIEVVKNITFLIEKNQTLGLLGPNGCGKTTSIGMMLGLIKPTSGSVLIDGKDINKSEKNSLLSLDTSKNLPPSFDVVISEFVSPTPLDLTHKCSACNKTATSDVCKIHSKA